MSDYQPSDAAITALNVRRHNGHGTDLQLRDAVNAEIRLGRLFTSPAPIASALQSAAGLAQAVADQQGRVDLSRAGAGPYEIVREDHPAKTSESADWTEWHVFHETGVPEYASLSEADATAVCAALNAVARGRSGSAAGA